ncbi:hypothetical protein OHB35_01390 [Streptomyces phaeochromogenes]|uniref:Uncharacterized protein n=1 Tax=Streptomyces phaeochromogenes TaxID=1923 RepID=A0ABZ1H0M6_STRPH|nr:hypothetical protein [Streptomyces phaeochromogenes]WSD11970.1 hypothetical protein OHB35_01390 [Streptomyces phaeochromogenes]
MADHVHTSEGAAQDRADRREPPFAQTDPVQIRRGRASVQGWLLLFSWVPAA